MKRTSTVAVVGLAVAVMLLVAPVTPAFAEDEIPVADLLKAGADLAGRRVTVVGELVGDYGVRSNGSTWAQLNDDSYARDPLVDGGPRTGPNIGVGIRIAPGVADGLQQPGRYRQRGPLVAATGVWVYHDPDRGGESYVDVDSLEIIDDARPLSEDPSAIIYAIGIALLGAAAVLWLRKPRSR